MGWRNRPKFLRSCPDDVDYIMFVDENGDDNLSYIQRCHANDTEPEFSNIYFTITGCIVHRKELPNIKHQITELKMKHWENGLHEYDDGVKRICLHSREIRRHDTPFSDNDINYGEFINDLSAFLDGVKTDIVSITINKDDLCKRYTSPYNPYEISSKFLLERYSKFLNKNRSTGIVLLEQRAPNQDKDLLNYMKKVLDNGTGSYERNYVESSRFNDTLRGIYFNSKWCHYSQNTKSHFGLEIADLLSYPIHHYVRSGCRNKTKSFLTLEPKLYNYPNCNGFGFKVFP